MRLPYRRIHVVGAGGAGMSAIAKILLAGGQVITGSDLRGGAGLQGLADLGVEVATGHVPEMALAADLVVASSAVPDYDEELIAAREAGIPIWRRPAVLEAITGGIPSIGATGTHGKTSTTAMIVTGLRSMGHDPSFIVGGDLVGLGTNGHLGHDDLLVLECDEAFRTFESLHLQGLVVTNVEPEHVEHFGDQASLVDSFVSVAARVSGPVLACLDDSGSAEVAQRTGALTYGSHPSADWRIEGLSLGRDGVAFRLAKEGRGEMVTVPRPGRHVATNAGGALALLAELGYDLKAVAGSLRGYRGVGRRWEHRGTVAGVILYDDYAHHPTEVTATLEAARGLAPERLWAVFQPHLYSRTERLKGEFGSALASADVAVVTDVYGAREEPVPGVTGELVADAARDEGVEVHYVPHRVDLAPFLEPKLRAGDMVVSMGAGDITLLHGELAAMLASRR